MFDSAPGSQSNLQDSQVMKTIPQGEGDDEEMGSSGEKNNRSLRQVDKTDDSHLLGSEDFTGQGASIDIRKVLAEGENDGMGNKNGEKNNNEKKKKKRKKSKAARRGGRDIKRSKTAGSKKDEDQNQSANQNGAVVTMSSPKSQSVAQKWAGEGSGKMNKKMRSSS